MYKFMPRLFSPKQNRTFLNDTQGIINRKIGRKLFNARKKQRTRKINKVVSLQQQRNNRLTVNKRKYRFVSPGKARPYSIFPKLEFSAIPQKTVSFRYLAN
jgi:hypothetical protein